VFDHRLVAVDFGYLDCMVVVVVVVVECIEGKIVVAIDLMKRIQFFCENLKKSKIFLTKKLKKKFHKDYRKSLDFF